MSAAPYVEPPGYRSVIRLLSLYCLYQIIVYIWYISPLLSLLCQADGELFLQLLLMLLPHAIIISMLVIMLVVNFKRGPKAHLVRLILLGISIAQGIYSDPTYPGYEHRFLIVLNFFNSICDVLFFFFLLLLHRPKKQKMHTIERKK